MVGREGGSYLVGMDIQYGIFQKGVAYKSSSAIMVMDVDGCREKVKSPERCARRAVLYDFLTSR